MSLPLPPPKNALARRVAPPVITAAQLRMARAALNATQQQLAERLGVTGRAVIDWERGATRLSGERAQQALELFLKAGVVFPRGGIMDEKFRGGELALTGDAVSLIKSDERWQIIAVPLEEVRLRPERKTKPTKTAKQTKPTK